MKVPESTPKIGLIAESATIRSKWRIYQQKIMLVRRIQQQDMSCLARRVYEQQLKLGLPGLAREVTEICQTISIQDVNFYRVQKDKIDEHIYYHHYKDLKEQLDSSKKMSSVKHEDFRTEQSYFNDKSVDRCRTKFRVRTEMCETYKDNYRSKYRTMARGEEDRDPGPQCGDCGQDRDTQSHCLVCPAWEEDRDRLDLSDIEDLVTYFQRVLRGREEKEKESRKRRREE